MLIGYQHEAVDSDFIQSGNSEGLLTHLGEAPVAIIAPTGSGKGRDFVIPNILHHKGPLVVTDRRESYMQLPDGIDARWGKWQFFGRLGRKSTP